jgi:hypothetical protein
MGPDHRHPGGCRRRTSCPRAHPSAPEFAGPCRVPDVREHRRSVLQGFNLTILLVALASHAAFGLLTSDVGTGHRGGLAGDDQRRVAWRNDLQAAWGSRFPTGSHDASSSQARPLFGRIGEFADTVGKAQERLDGRDIRVDSGRARHATLLKVQLGQVAIYCRVSSDDQCCER